jgi:hypothetical protein
MPCLASKAEISGPAARMEARLGDMPSNTIMWGILAALAILQ